jgi:ABC-type methionine transport system permease subunit
VIGWIAVVWVGFIVVLFMLPPYYPVTVTSFNYAPVAVTVVLAFATITWYARGRHTFMRDVPGGHRTKQAAEIMDSDPTA